MNKVALLVLTGLMLAGCGDGGGGASSAGGSSSGGSGSTQASYTLTAARNYPGNLSVPADQVMPANGHTTVPATVAILANGAEDGRGTLSFGNSGDCYYRLSGGSWALTSCTNGLAAGMRVDMVQGDTIDFFIQDGYVTQTTRISTDLLVTFP